MISSLRIGFASLLVGCSVFAGCSAGPGAAPSEEVVVAKNAFVIGAESADHVIVEPTRLLFTFAGNEALLSRVAGDILVGPQQRPGTDGANARGFLRKVVNVSRVGEKIVVETSPASLEEVIKHGKGSGTLKGLLSKATRDASPKALHVKDAFGLGAGAFKFDGVLLEGLTAGVTAQLTEGWVSLDADLDVGADFGWSGLEEFHTIVRGTMSAGAKVKVSSRLGFADTIKQPLAKVPLPPLTFAIGPVPVVVTSELTVSLECKLSLTGSGTVEAGASASSSIAAGVRWQNEWQPITEESFSFASMGPQISGKATLELRCGPKVGIAMSVYDTAGPTVGLAAYVAGRVQPAPAPCPWSINAGVEASAGAQLKVPAISVKLAEAKFSLWGYETPVAQGELCAPSLPSCTELGGTICEAEGNGGCGGRGQPSFECDYCCGGALGY